jgi:hypothetical protein
MTGGRPVRKARLEAERGRGKRRFDAVAREAILKRAEEVGPAVAAREANVAVGTLRTWRKRLAESSSASVVGVSVEVDSDGVGLSRAVRLRARAARAREAEHRAVDRADSMIASGQAAESRNAMVSATGFADRARDLEEAAAAAELHEVALSEAAGKLVVDLVGRAFELVGLPVPTVLMGVLLAGGEPDVGVVEQACAEVRRLIAGEVRVELAAEEAGDPDQPEADVDAADDSPGDGEPVPEEEEESVVESEQAGETSLSAPRRVARSDWKLPTGWDRAGGGRHGGPAGRAGP